MFPFGNTFPGNDETMNPLRSDIQTSPRIGIWLRLGTGMILLLCWCSRDLRASDWIYRRSYFSHDIPLEKSGFESFPESRSAYRRAYVNPGPGFAVRGGYRINRIFLNDHNSSDLTVIRENWFQVRP